MTDEVQKELDNMLKELKKKLNYNTHEEFMKLDMSLLQEAANLEAKLEVSKPVIITPIKN